MKIVLRYNISLLALLLFTFTVFAQEMVLRKIRLEAPLTSTLRTEMAGRKIEILEYLGKELYLVRMPLKSLRSKQTRALLKEVLPFDIMEKIAPKLRKVLLDGEHKLGVRVQVLEGTAFAIVERLVEKLGGEVVRYDSLLRHYHCTLLNTKLTQLAAYEEVLWIFPSLPTYRIRDQYSKLLHNTHILRHDGYTSGLDLNGTGVRLGIWDETIDPHHDLRGKFIQEEKKLQSTSHGTHVAGIILGGGYARRAAQGMATQAFAWAYNFRKDESSTEKYEWEEMQEAYDKFKISLTNNSYGYAYDEAACADYFEYVYDYDAPFDILAREKPLMTHVFAAGNERDQAVCQNKFNRGYGSSTSRGKNLIYVGSVTGDGSMTSYSSWGPMDDGRLLPTVVAHGSKVLSTVLSDEYGYKSGTSMAAPNVTGLLALVTEYYGRENQGAIPRSEFLRALVANCARDCESVGPDYASGYGLVDLPPMLEVVKNRWYTTGKFTAQGGIQEHTIMIPNGTFRARVMLVWNDAVSKHPHTWGEKALINDLDLRVLSGGKTYFPWVLDPSNPDQEATTGIDHLNTMEQVCIALPGETLKVQVEASTLPKPDQEYTLVWYFEQEPQAHILAPLEGEIVEETVIIKSEGLVFPATACIYSSKNKLLKCSNIQEATVLQALPEEYSGIWHLKIEDAKGREFWVRNLCKLPVPKINFLQRKTSPVNGYRLQWSCNTTGIGENYYYSVVMACGTSDATWQEIAQVRGKRECYIPKESLYGGTQVAIGVRIVVDGIGGRISDAKITDTRPKHLVAYVSTKPSAEAHIQMFAQNLEVLAEGAAVAIGRTVSLKIHTRAGYELSMLYANATQCTFTGGEGEYVATYKIPTLGLYPNCEFRAECKKTGDFTGTVLLQCKDDNIVVREEGVLCKNGEYLRRGVLLTLQVSARNGLTPEYFVVNEKRLGGEWKAGVYTATYLLEKTYAQQNISIACTYSGVLDPILSYQLQGGKGLVEVTCEGKSIKAGGFCPRGKELFIKVTAERGYTIDHVVCNGERLSFDNSSKGEQETVLARYKVSEDKTVSSIKLEILLKETNAGVADQERANEFRVFPNLFCEELHIEYHHARENTHYELFTLAGEFVQSGTLSPEITIVNVAKLEVGGYILRVLQGEELLGSVRLVKHCR